MSGDTVNRSGALAPMSGDTVNRSGALAPMAGDTVNSSGALAPMAGDTVNSNGALAPMAGDTVNRSDIMASVNNNEVSPVEERDEAIAGKYSYASSKRGAWILHFPRGQLGEVWPRVRQLYRQKQLTGIESFKIISNVCNSDTKTDATQETEMQKSDTKSDDKHKAEIRDSDAKSDDKEKSEVRSIDTKSDKTEKIEMQFICGPSDNENLLKSYGRNIIRLLNYTSELGYILYQSTADLSNDEMEAATKKCEWVVLVPQFLRDHEESESKTEETSNEILVPSSLGYRNYLTERNPVIDDKYKYDPELLGYWWLIVEDHQVDQAWKQSCILYRDRKLNGIQSIFYYKNAPKKNLVKWVTSQIRYYCGPWSDEVLILSYGQNLVNQLSQFSSATNINYLPKYPDTLPKNQDAAKKWLPLYSLQVTPNQASLVMINNKNWFFEERNLEIANKYVYDPSKRGKWLLYYREDEMDVVWPTICQLYQTEKLTGIEKMTTTTTSQKPSSEETQHVLVRFFCGPYDDEPLVKSYGQNLIKTLDYSCNCEYVSYKTDEQSSKGTRATGRHLNYYYRIAVPAESEDPMENPLPMSTTDSEKLVKVDINIYDRNKSDKYGMWRLFCHDDNLDIAWILACTLYKQNKLIGIQSLRCCTKAAYLDIPQIEGSRFITFFCGSSDNKSRVMEYGRCIAKHMQHLSSKSFLKYSPIQKDGSDDKLIKDMSGEFLLHLETKDVGTSWTSLSKQYKKTCHFYERNDKSLPKTIKYDSSKQGKWTMTFKRGDMDEMWAAACKLYKEKKLNGIEEVVTIAGDWSEYSESRSEPSDTRTHGVILFACGPCDDEKLIKQYGEHLVKKLDYHSLDGVVKYESNELILDGIPVTQAKYFYLLAVPKVKRNDSPGLESIPSTGIIHPLSIRDRYLISDTEPRLHDRYSDWDQRFGGHWYLICKKERLDDAWKLASRLYREGKLQGIQSISSDTAVCAPRTLEINKANVTFKCGPCDDRYLMVKYGTILAELLGSFSARDTMKYFAASSDILPYLRSRRGKWEAVPPYSVDVSRSTIQSNWRS